MIWGEMDSKNKEERELQDCSGFDLQNAGFSVPF